MLRDGPIPAFIHGVAEYLAGVLLVVAPLLFGFDSQPATVLSVVAGVVVLIVAATTRWSTSLVKHLPLSVHVGLDYVFVVVLVASPYVLDFSDETAPTALFLALGIVHLMLTIGTCFLRPDAGAEA